MSEQRPSAENDAHRERVAEALFDHIVGNGYTWPAPEQHLPWWYAAADAVIAAYESTCRHCGRGPDADADHSCPCPYTDAECPGHCRCGCSLDMHVGDIGCPCALPGEPPCVIPPESSAS